MVLNDRNPDVARRRRASLDVSTVRGATKATIATAIATKTATKTKPNPTNTTTTDPATTN